MDLGGRGRPPLQASNVVCSVIQFFSPVRLKGLSHLFLDETAPFYYLVSLRVLGAADLNVIVALFEGMLAVEQLEEIVPGCLVLVFIGKLDGDLVSQKFDNKYGIVNRILNKYKSDELFDVGEDDLIRPTRKMKDLMPYFLRKDRIIEIQNWIKEEESNAANQ